MAVDTTNEKLALMSWMQPWQMPLPISVDGLDQADNQQLLWGYPGILWGTVVVSAQRIAIYGKLAIVPWIQFDTLAVRRR
jgi:hypothetical protein